jgi:hypothetical protein
LISESRGEILESIHGDDDLIMKRFYLPKSARLACIIAGSISLFSAWQLDRAYQDGMGRIPPLVDARGHTASAEIAARVSDSYQHLQKIRRLGIVNLAVGILLFGCYGISTPQKAGRV